jgi:hypothetical protein
MVTLPTASNPPQTPHAVIGNSAHVLQKSFGWISVFVLLKNSADRVRYVPVHESKATARVAGFAHR